MRSQSNTGALEERTLLKVFVIDNIFDVLSDKPKEPGYPLAEIGTGILDSSLFC